MSDKNPTINEDAVTDEQMELTDKELLAGPPVETPTLEKVIAAGYKPEVAAKIVARQQAMADRQKALKGASKPHDYVMVQHMKYSRETRALRANRAGHRYHDVTLDTGRRIHRQGKRLTEVHHDELMANHQQILELVRVGELKVIHPKGHTLSYEDLKTHISNLLGQDEPGGEARLDLRGDHQAEPQMAALHREIMTPEPTTEPHGEPTQENPVLTKELAEESKLPEPTPGEAPAPTPPVDNEHVAEGAEQFSEKTIAEAKEAVEDTEPEADAKADKKPRQGRKGRKE